MAVSPRIVGGPSPPPPVHCPQCGTIAPWTRGVCPNCGALPPRPQPPPPPRPYDPSPYVAPPSGNYLGLHAPPPPPGAAWAPYNHAMATRAPNPDAKSGQAQALVGVLIMVVGLVVTVGTGLGIIAYGAILVGLINIISGAAKM